MSFTHKNNTFTAFPHSGTVRLTAAVSYRFEKLFLKEKKVRCNLFN